MSHTLKTIDIDNASRETLRNWVSEAARTIATVVHGTPNLANLRLVMNEVGHVSMSAVIADGTMETLRKAAFDLMALGARHGFSLESPTPPPPPVIPPTVSYVEALKSAGLTDPDGRAHDPDTEAIDDIARQIEEAADAVRKATAAMAAARAKATAAPAGLTDADRDRIDRIDAAATAAYDQASRVSGDLASLKAELGPISSILDALRSATGSAPSGPITIPPAVIASAKAAATGDRLLTEVLPFFTPGLPQGNQIPCVASPPSFGKTFMSDEISRLYDGSFFHPFKDALDEIDSLVGTLMPRSDGTFAVIDGPLVSAARLASTGVNTLFVGDEIFNASKRTLEWMQSFLSPRLVECINPDDGLATLRRCFVIQTKHSHEDGTFEVIKAPEEHLHFLFLGNLRTNPPEALMSRCRLMRFDYDEAWAVETTVQRLEGYSGGLFTGPDAKRWAVSWGKAMTASRAAYSRMEVSRPLCFRFLIGAITHVVRQPDPDLKKLTQYVAKWAPHQIAVQNAATQDTDPTSRELVQKMILTAWT